MYRNFLPSKWSEINTKIERINPRVNLLSLYIKNGSNGRAKTMIKDLHNATGDWITLLHHAVLHDNEEIIRYLIESFVNSGADVDVRNELGTNLLLFASAKGNLHCDVVKFLLERGADVDVRDKSGATPLFFASAEGNALVVKLLLERGADPNATDNRKCAPLSEVIFAFRRPDRELQFYECAKFLLQYGAMPSNLSENAYHKIFHPLRYYDVDYQQSIRELIINSMIAQLTLVEAAVDPTIAKSDKYLEYLNRLQSYSKFHECCAKCQQILDIPVVGTLCLRNLLIDEDIDSRIRTHARNKTLFAELNSKLQQIYADSKMSELYPYYYHILLSRVENASSMLEIEDKAILVISKIFDRDCNECYLVARRVVDYLGDYDLELLSQV